MVILVVILSLAAWTAESPAALSPQSQASVSDSLFHFAKTTELVNVTDGEGSYSFLFGMDYNTTVTPGVPTLIEVFASLVSEQKTSAFLKGVTLDIASSDVLLNGSGDSQVTPMILKSSGIIVDRLTELAINETSGVLDLSARLIITVVDVNYIGSFSGNQQVVSLNGTISIS